MKVISFLNQKGGVGKSTTVSTLMAYLKNKGYRVLGIDTDAQGHLSKLCEAVTEDENTILELFQNRATFDETVQSSPFGDIVPADYNLQLAVLQFANIHLLFKGA
ncbi:MAG: AAA family ATPase [Christensenellaceae bacterium]